MVSLYIAGVLYMVTALAVVADELFVPALDIIADKWELSEDVAGATLMAAGGGSPELATNLVATFLRSNVGFGTIVGSAVFNILFVVGICAIVTKETMYLQMWPIIRDCSYYVVVLVMLAVFFGANSPGVIDWYEALILFSMYLLYVYMMRHNVIVKEFFCQFTPAFALGHPNAQSRKELNSPVMTQLDDVVFTYHDNPLSTPRKSSNATTGSSSSPMGSPNNSKTNKKLTLSTDLRGDSQTTGTASTSSTSTFDGNSMTMNGGSNAPPISTEEIRTAFSTFDTTNEDSIPTSELQKLLLSLKCTPLDANDLEIIYKELDKEMTGKIEYLDFHAWFITRSIKLRGLDDNTTKSDKGGLHNNSEKHNSSKIPSATSHHIDIVSVFPSDDHVIVGGTSTSNTSNNNNGSNGLIATDEIPAPTDEDPRTSGKSGRSTQTGASPKANRSHQGTVVDTDGDADGGEESAPLSLYPPSDETFHLFNWVWYILTLPIVACLLVTVPDVRRPGYEKFAYFAFFMCLVWMCVLSYFNVTWIEIIGSTLGIPTVFMGLIFLALGASIPDMLAAIIVARQGKADKAVSSSIGSNVFDICIGLALPWLMFSLYYQQAVYVRSGNLLESILGLVASLMCLQCVVYLGGFTLNPRAGYFLLLLYGGYVAWIAGTTTFGTC